MYSNNLNRCNTFNPLMDTLKLHSNEPLYRNTVIGTLAVDGWAVTHFGTARRGLGGLRRRPVPSLPIHQRPVYQFHIIWCGTIITSARERVNAQFSMFIVILILFVVVTLALLLLPQLTSKIMHMSWIGISLSYLWGSFMHSSLYTSILRSSS